MKFANIFLLMPFLLLPVTAHTECQSNAIEEAVQEMLPQPACPNEKASVIIGSVGNILNHVGSIVSDPHSRPNIAHNATGILAHIINIALAAKHNYKSQQEFFTSLCDDLHLDDEMREMIRLKVEEIQRNESIKLPC